MGAGGYALVVATAGMLVLWVMLVRAILTGDY